MNASDIMLSSNMHNLVFHVSLCYVVNVVLLTSVQEQPERFTDKCKELLAAAEELLQSAPREGADSLLITKLMI